MGGEGGGGAHPLSPHELTDPPLPLPLPLPLSLENSIQPQVFQEKIAEFPCDNGAGGVEVGDAERAVVPQQQLSEARAVRVPATKGNSIEFTKRNEIS